MLYLRHKRHIKNTRDTLLCWEKDRWNPTKPRKVNLKNMMTKSDRKSAMNHIYDICSGYIMSEWLLFNSNSAIFSYFMREQ